MLQLTKRAEYGLIALCYLAQRSGEVVSAREIADQYPVPRRVLAEVLKTLCREELVVSQRGATGGYALARPANDVSVGDVVSAIEGFPALTTCQSSTPDTDPCEIESICPIKSPVHRLRAGIWQLLQETTLQDLVRGSLPTALSPE